MQKNRSLLDIIKKRPLNNRKKPIFPSLFQGYDEYVINSKKKNKLFHSFFAKQCSLKSNDIEVPLNLYYTTEKLLDTLNFSNNDIEMIIQHLNPNKISVCMINICGKSICKPLQLIFNHCIDTGSFPLEWEKANIIPVHKKSDKQCLKNC